MVKISRVIAFHVLIKSAKKLILLQMEGTGSEPDCKDHEEEQGEEDSGV
jgi:hypothetical protein